MTRGDKKRRGSRRKPWDSSASVSTEGTSFGPQGSFPSAIPTSITPPQTGFANTNATTFPAPAAQSTFGCTPFLQNPFLQATTNKFNFFRPANPAAPPSEASSTAATSRTESVSSSTAPTATNTQSPFLAAPGWVNTAAQTASSQPGSPAPPSGFVPRTGPTAAPATVANNTETRASTAPASTTKPPVFPPFATAPTTAAVAGGAAATTTATTVAPITTATVAPTTATTVAPITTATTVAPITTATTVAPITATTVAPTTATTVAPIATATTVAPITATTVAPTTTTTVAPINTATTVAPTTATTVAPITTATTVAPITTPHVANFGFYSSRESTAAPFVPPAKPATEQRPADPPAGWNDTAMYERDLIGYGAHRPKVTWPFKAYIAVNFVLNYEEGAERTVLNGDATSESFLCDIVGSAPVQNMRCPQVESLYEYGSRAGFWRLRDIFSAAKIPITVFAVAMALERNPAVVAAIKEQGWEVATHGFRWLDYQHVPVSIERNHLTWAVDMHTKLLGKRPVGCYIGRTSPNSARICAQEGGFLYDSDSYADDLPYYTQPLLKMNGDKGCQLVVPYTLDANDMKFVAYNGFAESEQFFQYLKDQFDVLYDEGKAGSPKMMSVGLHCRIAGKPARAAAVRRFINYVKSKENVWFATREDIALNWLAKHPPPQPTFYERTHARMQEKWRPTTVPFPVPTAAQTTVPQVPQAVQDAPGKAAQNTPQEPPQRLPAEPSQPSQLPLEPTRHLPKPPQEQPPQLRPVPSAVAARRNSSPTAG